MESAARLAGGGTGMEKQPATGMERADEGTEEAAELDSTGYAVASVRDGGGSTEENSLAGSASSPRGGMREGKAAPVRKGADGSIGRGRGGGKVFGRIVGGGGAIVEGSGAGSEDSRGGGEGVDGRGGGRGALGRLRALGAAVKGRGKGAGALAHGAVAGGGAAAIVEGWMGGGRDTLELAGLADESGSEKGAAGGGVHGRWEWRWLAGWRDGQEGADPAHLVEAPPGRRRWAPDRAKQRCEVRTLGPCLEQLRGDRAVLARSRSQPCVAELGLEAPGHSRSNPTGPPYLGPGAHASISAATMYHVPPPHGRCVHILIR